ncbi:MAG: 3'-5' exonuclease domain-containing protein 2 [Prolixibacteraceae bacterium]|nr:3'-5' exonuclease domain-containing protein 2 [Prolixibacteraceae bacterium]
MYKETITKEEMEQLPLHFFEGDIVVVKTKDQVKEAVTYLQGFSYLGFDTETRPSFKKGQVNPVALLQLSTAERAFLFRLNHRDLPRKVASLLANPEILKVGIAIRDDIKTLQVNKRFKPAGFVDLQDVAKEKGINNFSLKKLSGIVLGMRILKAQQLSNWEAEELTEAQLLYAATDAWVAYKIYERFSNGHDE